MASRILVIDDEEEVCDLIRTALERQGMSVTACTSPSRALERVACEPYDVVLTDLAMPEIDGIEVCERIASMNAALPVIVVTGHGRKETAAMGAGAFDFVAKPVDPELLVLVVGRAAEQHSLHMHVTSLGETGTRKELSTRRIGC
jgi:DNA-binding NtrC family response regulator